jgi:hypothetical protein
MARISCPSNALEQARAVLEAWKSIDPELKFGPLTVAALASDLDQVQVELSQITVLETRLIGLRNQRDALIVSAWDKVVRVRMGMKGIYGDDSSQYEMVGGTRLSEYKHTLRRKRRAGKTGEGLPKE